MNEDTQQKLQHARMMGVLLLVPMLKRRLGWLVLSTAILLVFVLTERATISWMEIAFLFGPLLLIWVPFCMKLIRLRNGTYGDNAKDVSEIASELIRTGQITPEKVRDILNEAVCKLKQQ